MLVDADPVVAQRGGVLELVEVLVVDPVPLDRVVEPRIDIDPDRPIRLPEIIR